jgi:hypothetical protein
MKLKSTDALPIENESTDVVASQLSPLRPYVSECRLGSSSSSPHYQSSTPDLAPARDDSACKETDRQAYLETEETPSQHSSYSEQQVEQAILYHPEDTPLGHELDSSGDTLVEDTGLLATHEWLL